MLSRIGLPLAVGALVLAVAAPMHEAAAQAAPSIAVPAPGGIGGDCKPLERATGRASYVQRFARNNSVANWRRAVILKYGEAYSLYNNARGPRDTCARTLRYMWKCEMAAEPCATAGIPGGPGGIMVNVAEAQSLLNRLRRYEYLKPDGIPGRKTERVVRQFQRDSGLPQTGFIDDATMRELRRRAGVA
jgi:hypothetical protein